MMRAVIIPARLGSTRFPAKVLAADTGKPLLAHVIESARLIPEIDLLAVATDSQEVANAARLAGASVVMTSGSHPNGTSRIAEACDILGLHDDTIVVNVQGDEPELETVIPTTAIDALLGSDAPMGTVAAPILHESVRLDPNVVKVVCDRHHRALYFSRAPIPYRRDHTQTDNHPFGLRHIGVYVYRRSFLPTYLSLEPAQLEQSESLEQLRVLEHGHSIVVGVVNCDAPAGIDTPEQYRAFVGRVIGR